jgi:hypothetical protein
MCSDGKACECVGCGKDLSQEKSWFIPSCGSYSAYDFCTEQCYLKAMCGDDETNPDNV